MNHDFDTILNTAIQAAQRGADVLMRYWNNGVEMRNKEAVGGKSYDLVSDADIESEQAVAQTLRSAYPDHELLGEEDLVADVNAEHLWVIDPLDGTNNYAHRIPHFAVSIGYYIEGQAQVAVVFNPARGDCYTAIRGRGSLLNGKPISVSESSRFQESLIGCGFYYDRGDMMRRTLDVVEALFRHDIHGIRRFGTASLDLCAVASGMFGGFFEYKLSPWDFAAGRLILEEAGGRITDAKGNDLLLETSSVVASNLRLHDELIQLTSKHHP